MNAGKIFKWAILLVVAGNLAIVVVVMLGGAESSHPLPNPNGFDDFVRAGKLLVERVPDSSSFSNRQWMAQVTKNGEVLNLVHTGLTKQCRVPADLFENFQGQMAPVLTADRKLAFLLCAEGKAAELAGQTNDAIKLFTDDIRFGQESSRGGPVINVLVGIANEAIALKQLQAMTGNLDAKQCADAARLLEKLDSQDEPVGDIVENEKVFSYRNGGLRGQIWEWTHLRQVRKTRQTFESKYQSSIADRRKAMLAFAARAYELEHGKPPATAADLVPAYLKSIPQDPMTGTNMVYNP